MKCISVTLALSLISSLLPLLAASDAYASPQRFEHRRRHQHVAVHVGDAQTTSGSALANKHVVSSERAQTNSKTQAKSEAFTHPGVLVSNAQLRYVKSQLGLDQDGNLTTASKTPWATAYSHFITANYTSLSWAASPRANVECGSYSNPNLGCTDERQDAIASYSLALAYVLTDNDAYAKKAIEVMDAWAKTLQTHSNSNAPLQTGWAGAMWPKAGELIRYYYGHKWPSSKQTRFQSMLRDIYLPTIINGSMSNGNWELVMMEAAIGIAVFLEDRSSYDKAMHTFQKRVPAYIYLASDGSLPKTVPKQNLNSKDKIIAYWQGQSKFVSGLSQETCRDFTHAGYGLASIANVAETARIQGNDIYQTTDLGKRLRRALEFHTQYQNGEPVPSWLCNGAYAGDLEGMTEVGFNAFFFRAGKRMPQTREYTVSRRPQAGNSLFLAWQTLTHAEQPN
ncbi:secreted protein [Tilletiaria anomala UBC 951]|uniref:Secreted protein n=1 Tax=Tilletiaria anomala (strain ATCC 24038 / CBS 436.72 / UBC 951) TaxID=1037660 RepID=A0A066VFT0_TILAU|nr:uncharacterized protein K437DRAFT_258582 [Tilletiaria anomala UBC 951]KDN40597.1 secreted protein [Tilletiaria anomala UBC 951]